ncbi:MULTISPECIES: PadR family transcriptional regulator [Rhodococcus]|jgi:DNA-binding PadR family transcriptional regulator|uniref:PadR family transcriptional regulator n=1 Tax=Rhodococcus TaxID=1827 RepID=UPI00146E375B|nr:MULTISPECIES: PadR family transcriptional regulator [Rhodococcus]MDI9977413.1 PadR family transcriptional regulator [Rhodococcus sp. IEGM 1307]QSE86702.1 PadR family transcriptional regulator [Rhodococcus koreensis]WKN60614.1 PadR family transcriptional regulator [Rhodococcus opacus]
MSLRHAILTALLERPSSGFDLARRFDRSIGYFWSATHQSIYRELATLEREGLIESLPQPPSRGKRKLYEVRLAGRSALVAWLGQYEEPERSRDALLVRLRAASVVGAGPLVEQMRLHREAHEERRAEYLEIAERDFSDPHPDASAQIQHLILLAGVGLETYWMTWLSDAIELLSEVDRSGHAEDQ